MPDYRVALFTLLRAGDDVPLDLIVGGEHFDPTVRTSDDPVVTRRIANRWMLRRRMLAQPAAVAPAVRARTTVLEFNPRIVTTWVIAGIRRILRRPTVVWGHAEGQGGSSPTAARLRHWQARLAGTLVVYTEQSAERAERRYPGVDVVAAPNGIYRSADAAAVRNDGDLGTAFVSCGRLVESKGVEALLEAFILATDRGLGAEATLEFIGSGSLEDALRQRADAAGIAERVRFHGAIDALDIDALQSVFDRAVASVSAGYVGLNVVQSMWFGVPMVTVRDAPHSPEFDAISDGRNGVLVDDGSTAGLANALCTVWDDRDVWLERRSTIATDARDRHSVETTVAGLALAMRRARRRRRRDAPDLLIAGPFPPPLTGAAHMTERLATELETRGITVRRLDVAVDSTSRSRRLIRRVAVAAAGTATMLGPRSPRSLYVSLPETWSMLGFVPVVLAARCRGRLVVLHHHIQTYLDPSSGGAWPAHVLFAVAGRRAVHLALNDPMRDAVAGMGVADVRVLNNAWCLDPGAGPAERPTGPLTVGYVSNIALKKGVDTLLDTFDELQHLRPEARLVLARPCDAGAEPLVEAAATRPGITYVGPVDPDGRERFLAGIDVFVFPTRNPEGQALVVLEAHRAGVPVVATEVGFLGDTVGTGGITLPPSEWERRAIDAVFEVTGEHADVWRAQARAQFIDTYQAAVTAVDEFTALILSRRT